jgi:hypothetical protein
MLQHNEPDGSLLCPNKHSYAKGTQGLPEAVLKPAPAASATPTPAAAAPAAPVDATAEPWIADLDTAKTLADLKAAAKSAKDAGVSVAKIKDVYNRNVPRVSAS